MGTICSARFKGFDVQNPRFRPPFAPSVRGWGRLGGRFRPPFSPSVRGWCRLGGGVELMTLFAECQKAESDSVPCVGVRPRGGCCGLWICRGALQCQNRGFGTSKSGKTGTAHSATIVPTPKFTLRVLPWNVPHTVERDSSRGLLRGPASFSCMLVLGLTKLPA